MNLVQRYLDLQKQKKLIRNDMKKKRVAITRDIYLDSLDGGHACIQKMDILGIGVGGDFTKREVKYCGLFCENQYCTDKYCRMFQKNNAYINSANLYESVKHAQWDLIKDALNIKNR